ncbi:hypothetical protein STAFG_7321 [Streptomyces afghaniensis 772]|uniref:Uncharacterized protein n=1 Tax=Streptomyces afghaniensis 772 TaxID=1283301 RepID=S4M8E0_9ACTN|nr:hypothetical protein STAFG_7321 [Streptomyces afghaniensis 772]
MGHRAWPPSTNTPRSRVLRRRLGLADELAEPVHARVRAKLEREPIEDLRVDFEDGYGNRPDAEEDEAAARAARIVAEAYEDGTAAPYMGIRMKCMEAPVRARGIRTLDIFLTGLMEAGGLPGGLVLTLPKVTYAEQVTAMARLLDAFEKTHGLEPGRIGFEIQIETSQSILAADGTATVARMIQAAEGRATGLHYGTFDYSACLGVSAAHQAGDHPAADHAKAVMQVAAAGTGVRVSDGSTNVLPIGPTEKVHAAWRLHYGLTRRALAPRLLPGLGHAPRPHPHPVRGRLRLYARFEQPQPPRPLRQPHRRRRHGRTRHRQGPQRLPAARPGLRRPGHRGGRPADRPDPRRPGGLRGAPAGGSDGVGLTASLRASPHVPALSQPSPPAVWVTAGPYSVRHTLTCQ